LAVFLQCYIDLIGRFTCSDGVKPPHNSIMVTIKGGNRVFQVHIACQPTTTINTSETPWQDEFDRDRGHIYKGQLTDCPAH
jgi:hypothetical protein